jgi:hypothetical protein
MGSVYVAANGDGVLRVIKYTEPGAGGGQPIPRASLHGWGGLVPGSITEGDGFKLLWTVSNTGDEDVLSVTAAVAPVGTTGQIAVLEGPAPASAAAMAPGGLRTFIWSLRALRDGPFVLQVEARGVDAGDGSVVGSRELVAGVFGRRTFAEEIVLYPNPVDGDHANIAVRLNADADRVIVNVYNPAFQRVFSASWRGVSRAEGRVVLTGTGRWAPGVYLVKVRAELVGGGEQVFPIARLVVSR